MSKDDSRRESSGTTIARYAFVLPALAVGGSVFAAELPTICVAGGCGASVSSWLGSGSASAVQQGNTLTVTQNSDRALLNWATFNISADGRVVFQQPSRTSIALNRIFQDSPSRIFGQLQANGEIYLINPNGFVFGRTAIVNAAGILASTLNISDSTFAAGIASPSLIQNALPALQSDGRVSIIDQAGNPVRGTIDTDGNIHQDPAGAPLEVKLVIQQGAKLATSGEGGRVLLAAPTIENAGSISAPGGQVIAAAGQKVYLKANSDPALRGFLVEVDAGGKVWNQLTGSIDTPRGNATLVGLAVNQDGRISATTTVNANGSIRLLARDTAVVDPASDRFTAGRTGTLNFGGSSSTTVSPELADSATAVDDQLQYASRIEGMGHQVTVRSGALLQAKGGEIALSALLDPQGPQAGASDPGSRLRVESGARIDVSGSSDTLPMSRNLVTVELRGSELTDSPTQRDGALRGKTVVIDARTGTPLANVAGSVATIQRSVAERTSTGGTATLVSDGDIVANPGSVFDVSGGSLNYLPGLMATSKLIGADGKLYDVGSADPNRTYVGLVNPVYRRVDDRWGQIELISATNSTGVLEPGYVEGKAAGTLQFAAPTLVLQGDFLGSSLVGPYQRDKSKLPSGGSLVIGLTTGIGTTPPFLDFRAPAVEFVKSAAPVVVADDTALPTGLTLQLGTDYLDHGFTRTVVNSNGTVTVPANTPMQLAAGSTMQLAGQRILIQSDITSPGGALQFTSRDSVASQAPGATQPGFELGAGVKLDVSGNWTNDALLPDGLRPVDAVAKDGGAITVALTTQQGGELLLGDGAALRADGGGHVARNGTLSAGAGGAITLAGNYNSRFDIGDDVGLSAFGVFGAKGGTFTLSAPSLTIGNDASWSTSQDTATTRGNLRLGTALFSDYGFSSVRLTALAPQSGSGSADILTVEAGTELNAQVRSRLLDANALRRATGSDVADFSTTFLPLAYQRDAESVSLTAGLATASASPSSAAGDLRIAAGAVLRGDAGSSFNLASTGSLFVDGTLIAPSGSIRAGLTTPASDRDSGFSPTQRVQIGDSAVLDVSGTTLLTPNDSGLLLGKVLDAGLISLNSTRGGILVEAGARLNLAGASAALDVPTLGAGLPYQRQQIGSAGGTLELVAPEALGLFGSVDAHAGASTLGQAAAGSLRFALTRSSPFSSSLPATFPATPREVSLGVTDAPSQSPVNGRASISSDFLTRAGFDSLQLQADGRINLASGVNLSLARRIALDTPELAVTGSGTVTLNAPYLAIGNSQISLTAPPAGTAGSGTLRLNGEFIDVIGASVLSGVAATHFNSSGDIRLRGTVRQDGSVQGSLLGTGDMNFAAARVYASTASQFSLTGADGYYNHIRFSQTGSSPGVPLSAASSINVTAQEIEQNGTLLAPFGSISLLGRDSVTFGAGSTTSVSGLGAVVPYGAVGIGDWYYSSLNGNSAGSHVGSTDVGALPSRRINVSGDTVSIAPDATVDLRGGGDLYAYEWEPGPGGSKDALAPGASPGLYAILPSQRGQYAPFDPQEYAGSTLTPGASVYLSGAPGLEAGIYPLLPARYALLPGAMLVRAVPGTASMAPGSVSTLKDGTPVVSGYLTFGSTGLGGTRYTGFELRPGSYGRELAGYHDYSASNFFAATAQPGGRTQDAGALSLFAGRELAAQGHVLTAAASGGLNASIDISARNLLVSNAMTGAAGQVVVSSALINSWQPSRLTLGGHVDEAGELAVTADTVTIGSGTTLGMDEVIVAARERVAVQSGATIATPSAADAAVVRLADDAASLQLSGANAGAAVLAVSDLRQLLPERSGSAAASGVVDIANGARVATGGAVTLDTPGGGALPAGALTLNGSRARVALGADHIVLGQAGSAGALQIGSGLQTALQGAAALRLSGTTVEVRDDVSLDLSATGDTRIDILAANLSNTSGSRLDLAARHITLAGYQDSSAGVATAGNGTLHASARQLTIGPGIATLNGFGTVDLTASERVAGAGRGGMVTAGNVAIHAPLIEAGTGADTSITAPTGSVDFTGISGATAPAARELGGALTVDAQSIHVGTTLAAHSGLISLTSGTDLLVNQGARIDVSGLEVTAAGRTLGSFGGTVALTAGNALTVDAGSTINAAGAADAAAGQLWLDAGGAADVQGTLTATSTDAQSGGAFSLQAQSIAGLPSLLGRLQTGGFTSAQQLHVQQGDIGIAAGQQVNASTVELDTETGVVSVAGALNAHGGDTRGAIRLFGGNGVTLQSTGTLNTDAANNGAHGGDIEIGIGAGGVVDLAPGSVVSARGASDAGDLIIRTPSSGTDLPIARLASTFGPLGGIQLTPVFEVGPTGNSVNAATFNPALTAATAFVNANGAAILARLANATAPAMSIRPEIELLHTGDLSVGPLNLGTWRFGGLPGSLSVRTTGSLTLNGVISDGFSSNTATPVKLDLIAGASSSLRFVGGADIGSIDPARRARGGSGDLTLASNAIVRTGTGNLFLGGSRDVKFNTGSAAFTSGSIGSASQTVVSGYAGNVVFPDRGGSLRLRAGRDVLGSPVVQSASTWQIRGTRPALNSPFAKSQGINVAAFRWNLGALGGGDLDVQAGGSVRDLSAAAAASQLVDANNQLQVFGGGSLRVDARGDIASSLFFGDGGTLRLRTDAAIGTDRLDIIGAAPLRTLLELGAERARLQARGDILLESVVNSTSLRETGVQGNRESVFFSYGDSAALDLDSAGGDIRLGSGLNATSYFEDAVVGSSTSASAYAFALYPGTLRAASYGGDIVFDSGRAFNLFPAARGQLDLFAAHDLTASAGGGIDMSDGVASGIPTIFAPQSLDLAYSEVLKVAAAARHRDDAVPVQVTAGNDISNIGFTFAKQARVTAGRDIVDTNIGGQNLGEADLTLISAGRDIRYSPGVDRGGFVLGGPGRLDVLAGRDVNLGFVNSGITTQGRLRNAAIASSTGADVTVMAGLAGGVDYSGFIDKVLAQTGDYDAQLIAYITRVDAAHGGAPDAASALARLRALPEELQQPFITAVFFAELVRAGRDANSNVADAFQRGYVAIDALFPQSGAQSGDAANNHYRGDLNMSFSRIYTLAGGNINVLVPGGFVNVGLANPPPSVAARPPSELGLVAQGAGNVNIFTARDVLVNSSRVFTLLGGNIAVWSTLGNIDAGRGAKTSLSSPPPTVLIDDTGNVTLDFKGAVAGSGIRTIATAEDVHPGDVDLIAPVGFVNAGDAGIGSAGRLNIAAQHVLGAENIGAGLGATGVPAETGGLGASLSGAAAAGGASTSASTSASDAAAAAAAKEQAAPLAQAALSWLDVFVLGLGEENCKLDDVECLKRQKQ